MTDFEPSIGTEYQKTRPALIISNDVANARATRVTVVPLTGTIRRMAIVVIVDPDKENGLEKQSLIRIPDICTFDKLRLKKRIGAIGKDKLNEVDRKLRLHLAL
jgi:mRNA interferase MazF